MLLEAIGKAFTVSCGTGKPNAMKSLVEYLETDSQSVARLCYHRIGAWTKLLAKLCGALRNFVDPADLFPDIAIQLNQDQRVRCLLGHAKLAPNLTTRRMM